MKRRAGCNVRHAPYFCHSGIVPKSIKRLFSSSSFADCNKYASGFKNLCHCYSIYSMSFTNGYYDRFNLIKYNDFSEIPSSRAKRLIQQWSKLAEDTKQIRLKYDSDYRALRKNSTYFSAHDWANEKYGTPALDGCEDDDGDEWVFAIILQRRRLTHLIEREEAEAHYVRVREEDRKLKHTQDEFNSACTREHKRRYELR